MMEQVQSNYVNINSDSLNEEGSDEIIDLTGDDISDEDTASISDEDMASISDEDTDNSSPFIYPNNISLESLEFLINYHIDHHIDAAISNNEIGRPLDLDMDEPFNEEIDEDSFISTSDEFYDDDLIYPLMDYEEEYDSMDDVIHDNYFQHVEHIGTEDSECINLVSDDEDNTNQSHEPVSHEPVSQEPVPQKPVSQEPVPQEPVSHEPVSQEPVPQEPVSQEPVPQEPVPQKPVSHEPVSHEPVKAVVNVNRIHFIGTTGEQKIFPNYSVPIYEEIKTKMLRQCFFENEGGRACFPFGVADLMELLGIGWLNDIIIEAYIKLIVNKCKNVHFLSTFFISSLNSNGVSIFTKNKKPLELYGYDKILIPVNPHESHWALIVAVPQTSEILYYDSSDTELTNELTMVLDFFSKYDIFKNPMIQPRQWLIKNGNSPKQDNSYDCGIFTCTNARYISFNKPLLYTQTDIPLARQRIAYELLIDDIIPFTDP